MYISTYICTFYIYIHTHLGSQAEGYDVSTILMTRDRISKEKDQAQILSCTLLYYYIPLQSPHLLPIKRDISEYGNTLNIQISSRKLLPVNHC